MSGSRFPTQHKSKQYIADAAAAAAATTTTTAAAMVAVAAVVGVVVSQRWWLKGAGATVVRLVSVHVIIFAVLATTDANDRSSS